MAGPGLAPQPELAWIPFCTPKPVSVCREPWPQPPVSAAVAPSRAKPGCVIPGEMAALFRALGVFVHTRGGGLPRGVSQGQASEGSTGLPTWASSCGTREAASLAAGTTWLSLLEALNSKQGGVPKGGLPIGGAVGGPRMLARAGLHQ